MAKALSKKKTSYPKDKIKILLAENIHPAAVEIFKNAGYREVSQLKKALSEEELLISGLDFHVLGIRSKTRLSSKFLESAQKLWAVGCFCIGTNQVNLETATKNGIAVFNAPYSNTRSVAELVIGSIIMLMRRIPEKNAAAHRGEWLKDASNSFEIRGKTLGIIGYGHIGSQVSVLAEGMGMKVIYYDIEPKLPLGNAHPVDSLEALLATSDVVTLHVPGGPETKNMLGTKELAKMKTGSFLINYSRGSVVVIDALRKAIQKEKIAGAAVDVFPEEPESSNDRFVSELQGLPNVLLTPHIGGSTTEAQESIGIDVATKLVNLLDTGATNGSHSVPAISLPVQKGASRVLHVHRNIPGVITQINSIIGNFKVNVLGQYLKTNDSVGYVVFDMEPRFEKEILAELRAIEGTIKARLLY